MTCAELADCLLLTSSCSWLIHNLIISFSNLLEFFVLLFDLSRTYSQLVHNLFRSFSAYVNGLFTTFPQLVISYELFMICSWHTLDLFTSCSCSQLVHDLFKSFSQIFNDLFIYSSRRDDCEFIDYKTEVKSVQLGKLRYCWYGQMSLGKMLHGQMSWWQL